MLKKQKRRAVGRPKADVAQPVGQEELVRKAAEFFKTHSIANFSWVALGDFAGVSAALYQYYFRTKHVLLRELTTLLLQEARDVKWVPPAGKTAGTEDGLNDIVKQLITFYRTYPYFLDLIDAIEAFGDAKDLQMLADQNRRDVASLEGVLTASTGGRPLSTIDLTFLFITLIGACGYAATRSNVIRLILGERAGSEDMKADYGAFLAGLIRVGLSS